jgi:Ca2+/Na+ antiporter
MVASFFLLYLLNFEKGTVRYFGRYSFEMFSEISMAKLKEEWTKKPAIIRLLISIYFLSELVQVLSISFLLISDGLSTILLFLLFLLFVGIVLIYLIWKGSKTGRILGIVDGILALIVFPIGTILGLLTLYILVLDKEGRQYFER